VLPYVIKFSYVPSYDVLKSSALVVDLQFSIVELESLIDWIGT